MDFSMANRRCNVTVQRTRLNWNAACFFLCFFWIFLFIWCEMTHLQGQPAQGKGQHGSNKQREGPFSLLAPLLLAPGGLPRHWVAFQADGNGAVGHADGQQRHHVGDDEYEAGIQQPQVAIFRPEFLTHHQINPTGPQVYIEYVKGWRHSQGER